jgi:signal transduction histidine kinase
MTIRSKVLLFAAVAIGLVFTMGMEIFQGTQQGMQSRQYMGLIHDRIDVYSRMRNSAWPFLDALRHSQRDERSITRILHEQDTRMDQDFARLAVLERQELALSPLGRHQERGHEQLAALHKAQHRWVEQAAALAHLVETDTQVSPEAWWDLFQDFEREVGQRLEAAIARERDEMDAMGRTWDERALAGQRMAKLTPALALVLVVGLALAILDPLRRSLRELLAGVERIGHGDFERELPVEGHDELARLARAFNRMAAELRDLMHEKRRYNTLLEETVRTRTTELASSNARLEESLQKLQATQNQLLRADRLATIGQLAAGVGHEINNPLAYILSNLHYIQDELRRLEGASSKEGTSSKEGFGELLAAATEACEGAERVRFIVQDLKALARPDDAALGPVELREVVRGAAKMAGHEIRPRARFVEDCGGVPPVLGNEARLGQVLLNLLINASHAIEPGQVERNEIRVAARESAPGRVTLEVSDTGCGIPPENLERIFDPFFTTKAAGVGTGLGLSVCQRIITSLGGELTVESHVGQGTTFRITLSVAENDELPRPARVA